MKKFVLKATVAAAAVLASGLSFAAVNLDASPVVPANFATELVVNNTTALGAGAALDISHVLGFGVSTGQNRYLRYNFENATLNAAVTAADLSFGGAPAISVVQGGSAGDNYVIFQVTPDVNWAQSQAVALALTTAKLKVVSKSLPINVKYALYGESASDASNQTNAVYQKSAALATFSTGLALGSTPAATTADVTKLYKDFKANSKNAPDGFVSTTTAGLGGVTFNVTGALAPATGAAALFVDLVAVGTKLVVTGKMGAAASVSLSTLACAAPVVAGSITGNSADIPTGVLPIVSPGLPICFTNNTTTPVEVDDYTVAVDVTPPGGVEKATPAAVPLGSINRDGTVLKFTAISYKAGSPSWIQLANSSTIAAPYTATCYTNAGNVAGNPGSVAAGTTQRVELQQVCGSKTQAQSIVLTFAVPSGSVNGTVIRKDGTTGAVSSVNASAGNQ